MILEKSTFTTPTKHAQRLVTPPYKNLSDAIDANTQLLLKNKVNILDIPLNEHRSAIRPKLLHHSKAYMDSIGLTTDNIRSKNGFIATGHQCQFFHPGITIKYALTNTLAKQKKATPINLIVDTDTSKNLGLTVPIINKDHSIALTTLAIGNFDKHTTVSSHDLPSQQELAKLYASFLSLKIAGITQSQKENIVAIFKKCSEKANCLTDFYCLVNHHLGHSTSCDMLHLPVSVMAKTDTFYAFCYDMIINCESIYKHYNTALTKYRKSHRLRNKTQPLPDLYKTDEGFIELPFWLLTPKQPRAPLFIKHHGPNIVIAKNNKPIGLLPCNSKFPTVDFSNLLKENNITIAPRAITLSIFARLFIADMFIHGTGGARYDQISDMVISDYYGIAPPQICAATATMHLPLDTQSNNDIIEAQLNKAKLAHRSLQYNCEKHINNVPHYLIEEKMKLIERHNILKGSKGNKHEKREIFNALLNIRHKIKAHTKDAISENKLTIKRLQAQLKQHNIATGREYFTGLFSKEALDKVFTFYP